ncbi:hypothetical protein AgCh_000912 [Apium graveolens]
MRIINKPRAAAIAYGLDKKSTSVGEKNVSCWRRELADAIDVRAFQRITRLSRSDVDLPKKEMNEESGSMDLGMFVVNPPLVHQKEGNEFHLKPLNGVLLMQLQHG